MLGRIGGIVGALIGAVISVALIAAVVFAHPYRIPSASMEPTLHCAKPGVGCRGATEDRVVALSGVGWGRGDVVAFHAPETAVERCGFAGTFIKRVVGLPGDVVHLDGRTWRVPPGTVFLVGDNRGSSCDSRVYGPVPRGRVIAKVVLRYWPLGRFGGI